MKTTTVDEALAEFGLRPPEEKLESIREMLHVEAAKERDSLGAGDCELMLLFSLYLFNCGVVSDSELIWYAKRSSMDSDGAIDVQLLCGAGLDVTKQYLSDSMNADAQAALAYLEECEQAGDFEEWEPAETSATYQNYYYGD